MEFCLCTAALLPRQVKMKVTWPILGICALHLTHPKCTHTRSSGQPMLRHPGSSWGFGALLKGTSVVVLRVERVLDIHSPLRQFLPARDLNSQPLDYESCTNTSTDATGHIFSDVPGIIGCFGSFNIIHPHPGDPAEADQTPACVQLANLATLPPWISSLEP